MRLDVPSGWGTTPVPQYSDVSHTEKASAASNREASMYWPTPEVARPMCAARIA